MPDIFVPIDTSYETNYLDKLFASGSMNQFSYDYVDANRASFRKYTNAKDYISGYSVSDELLKEFVEYASAKGVEKNEKEFQRSQPFLRIQIKAYIGRLLFQNQGLYPVLHEKDPAFIKAMSILRQSA